MGSQNPRDVSEHEGDLPRGQCVVSVDEKQSYRSFFFFFLKNLL
jgi:hypothetical protein